LQKEGCNDVPMAPGKKTALPKGSNRSLHQPHVVEAAERAGVTWGYFCWLPATASGPALGA